MLLLTILWGISIFVALIPSTLRPIKILYVICLTYYGPAAVYYWRISEGGYFLGVYWGDYIDKAGILICFSILWQVVSLEFFSRSIARSGLCSANHRSDVSSEYIRSFANKILAVGALSAAGVILTKGDSIVDGEVIRGGIFLIVYQMSDLIIPSLLVRIAVDGYKKSNVVAAIFYALYCLTLGLRYKLVLFFFPLLLLYVVHGNNKSRDGVQARLIKTMVVSFFCFVTLSLLTISRKKFSGIDIEAFFSVNGEDFAFAAMAESNIIFGLISLVREYHEVGVYRYFGPLWDVFLEFVPRALMPERSAGAHLVVAMQGLGVGEAMLSGTAHPYIAEFIVMYGYIGVVVGVGLVSVLIFLLSRFSLTVAAEINLPRFGTISIGLLAAFFAYYFFSRGYLPQATKNFVFIILPMIAIQYSVRSKMKRNNWASQ